MTYENPTSLPGFPSKSITQYHSQHNWAKVERATETDEAT